GVTPSMTQFLGSFTNSDYYGKSYTFGPTVDYGKVLAFFNANKNNQNIFVLDAAGTALNTFSNSYDLVERVSAGYLMNTLQFGRVRLQTGLRFEATNEDVLGNIVGVDDAGNPTHSPLRHSFSYLDPLPSVQVRFGLPHDAAIRASYGRGIARPNFSDLPPTFNSTNLPEIDIGNPNLKPTHANNYDLLYEQYLKPLGLLQAGFFYKQLSDPIYQTRVVITQNVIDHDPLFGSLLQPFLGNGNVLVQQINGSSANVYGFEIAYQQHLTFLPGLLSGLGIAANYGYTHSSTDGVPLRSDHPALQRQAPNTWNISPTYDRGRLAIRVGVSHNDANIFSYGFQNLDADGSSIPPPLGKSGPHGDTYLYAHTQVDAQAAFRMYRGIQLIVSGLNLTNEVFGFYNGSTIFPIQREYYKPTYLFGLRYTFSSEPK
ncbi:MAG TPA: TonB-dependent receptor, partial [Terriglobales bacterium]|nr:TonB-dependent receptor [Terriglobales bacterium]